MRFTASYCKKKASCQHSYSHHYFYSRIQIAYRFGEMIKEFGLLKASKFLLLRKRPVNLFKRAFERNEQSSGSGSMVSLLLNILI